MRSAGVRLRVLAAAVILSCAPSALAHHAFAQTYVPDKTVKIEGRVAEFLFRNPHSVVLIETPGENGRPVTWAAEWRSAGQLSRMGIEMNTIRPGDQVIVTGNPSRNSADRRVRLQSITRPSDGWRWISTPQ